ncbi:MAG: glycosyltransferase family 2 protein [Polymorphobacter sp.]|uniref:glycosyltransferase family 2 protein n=1 Tax=Polymorphobacter sp. TaxID=1909290 RepID=UPI003A8BBCA5
MASPPKVSVIVPAYNAASTLAASIDSLQRQTLNEIEIVVVDDASTDETNRIIHSLAAADARIVALRLRQNAGVHEARLAGMKACQAPWIGFLDADDFARPAMYSTMLEAGLEHAVDIVMCGSDRVTDARVPIAPKQHFGESRRIEADIFRRLCTWEFGTGSLWNKLFRRSVIAPWFDLHFPWKQSINEDLLLNIGCFSKANSVYLLRDVLHEYVRSERSVTSIISPTQAFTETFRAYALAVSSFQHLGDAALSDIIDLYRLQLNGESCRVDRSAALGAHRDELEAAVTMLFRSNPQALAAITARGEPATVSGHEALRSLYKAVRGRFRSAGGRKGP